MNLEEALKMAVNTVEEPVNVTPVQPVAEVSPVDISAQMQTQAPVQSAYTQPLPQSTYSAPVQSAYSQPTGIASMPSIDLNQAQDQAMNTYGVRQLSFGQVVSTRAIEPVRKLNKGESFRFTIVGELGFLPIHKHPTLGKIKCFSDDTHFRKCCQDCGEPQARYFFPVVIYSTMPGDPRTPLPQGKSEFKLLNLWSEQSYQKLCNEILNNNKVYKGVDFIATSEDDFGRLDFRMQPTSFSTMPEYSGIVAAAEQKWPTIRDRAPEVVCRNMDENKYMQMTQLAQPPQMQSYGMNNVFQDRPF